MSRKRKAVRKPIAAAAEALYWRATVLLEAIAAATQLGDPIKRVAEALADFDASREPLTIYVCAACGGTCSEVRDGCCRRCNDAQLPTNDQRSLLTFAEMQS